MDFNVHLIEMADGNSCLESSNNLSFENDDDEGTKSSFVNARNNSESINPSKNTSMKITLSMI